MKFSHEDILRYMICCSAICSGRKKLYGQIPAKIAEAGRFGWNGES